MFLFFLNVDVAVAVIIDVVTIVIVVACYRLAVFNVVAGFVDFKSVNFANMRFCFRFVVFVDFVFVFVAVSFVINVVNLCFCCCY